MLAKYRCLSGVSRGEGQRVCRSLGVQAISRGYIHELITCPAGLQVTNDPLDAKCPYAG